MGKEYEDNSRYMHYLHALPYVLVTSALFFLCFWASGDATCGCRGDSTRFSCCALFLHALLWLMFFVISTALCVLGLFVKFGLDRYEVTTFKGNPTIKDLLDHVRTHYPEFWNLVFADMTDGLELFLNAALVFEVFCIAIMLYGCGVCCCRPYRAGKAEQ